MLMQFWIVNDDDRILNMPLAWLPGAISKSSRQPPNQEPHPKLKMSSVLRFFKSDKKKKNSSQYLEISEIGMPTQVIYLKLYFLLSFLCHSVYLKNVGNTSPRYY